MLLTIPAMRAIRNRYPQSHIALLAKPSSGGIPIDLGVVDSLISIEKHAFDRILSTLRPGTILSLAAMLRRIRNEHPDAVVLFHHFVTFWGTLKFAALVCASRAKRRIGLEDGRGWFLTESVPDRGFGFRHESEYWMDVAGLLDAHGGLDLEVPVTAREDARAAELLAPALREEQPIIALHPGTGWYGPGRKWPAKEFARTFELISMRRPVVCVIVGSESDRKETRELKSHLRDRCLDLTGKTSLGELGAVLRRCGVVVANDGGVGHVASAVRTPVVSIFGPSNDRAWRPLTATVMASDLSCRPCFYRDHERGLPNGCSTRECLSLVRPHDVAEAAIDALDRNRLAV
jgi:ADP-heptose:LPS heptosyltransferase